jgi:hypothetical protein
MLDTNQDFVLLVKDKINLVGVEIGVERGGGAHNLLSMCDIKMLYLIDPYLPYTDIDGTHVCDADCQQNNKNICVGRLRDFNNFTLIEKTSDDAVNGFEDESLDFVFIDGLHTYDQCKKDMENFYPKLKFGGIFSGHDYRHVTGVRNAVDEFSEKVNKSVAVSDKDVWHWIK